MIKKKTGVFNRFDNINQQIIEGYTDRNLDEKDYCSSNRFVGSHLKHDIEFDHHKEKRVYFISRDLNNKAPYVFVGVYELVESFIGFKNHKYKVRRWKRIFKDWEI